MWSEVARPTERQIKYAEHLLTKVYGEIVYDIYSMSKNQISELISKMEGKLNERSKR